MAPAYPPLDTDRPVPPNPPRLTDEPVDRPDAPRDGADPDRYDDPPPPRKIGSHELERR